jgi:hypothetical protein
MQLHAGKHVKTEIWSVCKGTNKGPFTRENIVQMSGILHEQRFHLVDKQDLQACEGVGSVAVANASTKTSNAEVQAQLSPLAFCLSEH